MRKLRRLLASQGVIRLGYALLVLGLLRGLFVMWDGLGSQQVESRQTIFMAQIEGVLTLPINEDEASYQLHFPEIPLNIPVQTSTARFSLEVKRTLGSAPPGKVRVQRLVNGIVTMQSEDYILAPDKTTHNLGEITFQELSAS